MIRTKQIEDDSIVGIHIAPVINVALVLVLILMITAPIINMPNITINLPKAVTIEGKEQNITISYAKDGRIAINTQVVSWNDLLPEIKYRLRQNRKILVIIRADKDIPYGEVEKILDIVIKQAGAKRIAVATEQRKYKEIFKIGR
jgi:biopolymer transport protein ExbD